MESGPHFDLQLAIELYLQDIDQDHLLDRDEKNELFDHFLSGTEELMQQGYSEEEAFEHCKAGFGETDLISREYARARPFRVSLIAAAGGLLLFFSIPIINSLMLLIAAISYRGGQLLDIPIRWISIGNLALMVLLLGGIGAYLLDRLKKRPYFRKAELWAIPVSAVLLPLAGNVLLMMAYNRSTAYRYQIELISSLFTQGNTITQLSILIPVITVFVLRHRSRRSGQPLLAHGALSGSFFLFFYLLLGISSISLLSPLSLYAGHWLGFPDGWIKMSDIVLKITMVLSLLGYVGYRLKKQQFFGSVESVVLPILGLICPWVANWTFWFVDAATINVRLINQTVLNSATIFQIALVLLILLSYVLISRTQKRLTAGWR